MMFWFEAAHLAACLGAVDVRSSCLVFQVIHRLSAHQVSCQELKQDSKRKGKSFPTETWFGV